MQDPEHSFLHGSAEPTPLMRMVFIRNKHVNGNDTQRWKTIIWITEQLSATVWREEAFEVIGGY